MIYVLDFGSQYTQLIAKKLRRLGYRCEVQSGLLRLSELEALGESISGLVLSGSPASVEAGLEADTALIESKYPVLGICFGYHLLAKLYGGRCQSNIHKEYGAAWVNREPAADTDPLCKSLPERSRMWMSHGDSVLEIPQGAKLLLSSEGRPAAYVMPEKKVWALQFHPEVSHSAGGEQILEAFAGQVCGLAQDWKINEVKNDLIDALKKQLAGVDEVLLAASGGVDSSVLAVLLSQVCRVKALFVDHGFSRSYDLDDVAELFSHYPQIEFKVHDASDLFWSELKGISDPEEKRKIMGRLFIDVFKQELKEFKKEHGAKSYLAQGTIYSDVIESAANPLAKTDKIKSHHNVGGLPELHGLELVEPLRALFKDEVRELGSLLGISKVFLDRHPFPGPGLAIRCVGALEPERIEILRKADAIFHEELKARSLYTTSWQALAVLLPVQSVGVKGDARSYESVLVLRAVDSLDAMTAEATEFPWEQLKEISSVLLNKVDGINRVVYDLTSKPPGTIEWE